MGVTDVQQTQVGQPPGRISEQWGGRRRRNPPCRGACRKQRTPRLLEAGRCLAL